MEKSSIKVGDSIENEDKYFGEGELIVKDINKYGIDGIIALNFKYKTLNGQILSVSNHELEYYRKV